MTVSWEIVMGEEAGAVLEGSLDLSVSCAHSSKMQLHPTKRQEQGAWAMLTEWKVVF